MASNRIRDVIVNHIMMKKQTIYHISVIWDTEVMKLFTQSQAYWKYNHKTFMVVMPTKLEQNKFNWK